MCWLRCRISLAVLRSAIMCVRGSRSSLHRPICEMNITQSDFFNTHTHRKEDIYVWAGVQQVIELVERTIVKLLHIEVDSSKRLLSAGMRKLLIVCILCSARILDLHTTQDWTLYTAFSLLTLALNALHSPSYGMKLATARNAGKVYRKLILSSQQLWFQPPVKLAEAKLLQVVSDWLQAKLVWERVQCLLSAIVAASFSTLSANMYQQIIMR